jgi:hypothetical protein
VKARLDGAPTGSVIALTSHLRAPQAPVLAGDTALDGILHARDALGKALGVTASRFGRLFAVTKRRQP